MTDTPNNQLEINFVEDETTPLESSQKKAKENNAPQSPSPKESEEIQLRFSEETPMMSNIQENEKQIEIDLQVQEQGVLQISTPYSSSQGDFDPMEFLQACRCGNLKILEELASKLQSLLQCKRVITTVMTSKIKGNYAIHVILENAQDEVLKMLLDKSKHVGQWLHLHSIPCMNLALKCMLLPKLRRRALSCFLQLLERFPELVTERDRLGRTAFHWACIVGSEKAVQVLLKSKAKVNDEQWRLQMISDLEDKQPVHYAIERDHAGVLALLLNQLGSELLVQSENKKTLLEQAIYYSSWKCLLTLLSVGGTQLLMIPNSKGDLPALAAQEANNVKEFEAVLAQFEKSKDQDINQIIADVVSHTKPTLLITSNHCNMHKATEERYKGYPEKPERLESLINSVNTGVLQGIDFSDLIFKKTASQVKIADVLRVHEYNYISKLEEIIAKCKRVDQQAEPGAPPSTYHLDSDTYMNQYTLNAAKVAAGGVIDAINQVMQGKVRNAFVAVRPPGHHCGPIGAVISDQQPEAKSNGFCFYNSVAIGGAYIRCIQRAEIARVAIVDFDVHHGNGTEQIVRNLRPTKIKQKVELPFMKGTFEFSSYKPWLDQEDSKNVLFISSHGYDELGHDFYPMSGTESTDKTDSDYPGGILNLPYPKYASSALFRDMYTRKVFPRLAQFKPDFILLSAGFDAHQEDEVNDNFGQWNEHDYAWLTEQLIKIANTFSKGRLVSILEGGYCIEGGHLSPFAQSVATHVRELARSNSALYKPLSEQELKMNEKEQEHRLLRKREMRVERRFSLRKRKTDKEQNPLEGRQEQQEEELKNGNAEGKSEIGAEGES